MRRAFSVSRSARSAISCHHPLVCVAMYRIIPSGESSLSRATSPGFHGSDGDFLGGGASGDGTTIVGTSLSGNIVTRHGSSRTDFGSSRSSIFGTNGNFGNSLGWVDMRRFLLQWISLANC
jgi:hypothetical protein